MSSQCIPFAYGRACGAPSASSHSKHAKTSVPSSTLKPASRAPNSSPAWAFPTCERNGSATSLTREAVARARTHQCGVIVSGCCHCRLRALRRVSVAAIPQNVDRPHRSFAERSPAAQRREHAADRPFVLLLRHAQDRVVDLQPLALLLCLVPTCSSSYRPDVFICVEAEYFELTVRRFLAHPFFPGGSARAAFYRRT
eukprot:COSAG01_NODE_11806_length_1855_cov_3.867882_3_plen_198_part_00